MGGQATNPRLLCTALGKKELNVNAFEAIRRIAGVVFASCEINRNAPVQDASGLSWFGGGRTLWLDGG